jgi:hypothetical protein
VRLKAVLAAAVALGALGTLPAAAATPAVKVVNDASKPSTTELTGVTCLTPSHCFAVGYRQTDSDYLATIEQGYAKTWARVGSPNPAGKRPNDFPPLSSVACSAPKNCFAVGTYYNASDQPTALIQHWNGNAWKIMKAAAPVIVKAPHAQLSQQTSLSSVTCPTAKSCYAVGYYEGLNGAINTLVEHWTGTTWASITAPTSGALTTVLYGVSCVSDTSCFAVGTSMSATHTKPFIIRWNGTAWSTSASPGLAYAGLSDISCAGPKTCFAIGSVAAQTTSTLLERWNGTKWSVIALENMPTANHLFGISCPTTTNCLAVGRQAWGTAGFRTLALRWNGSAWSPFSPPNQPGATSNWLNSVDCSNATVCHAVGAYVSNDNLHSFVENFG